jgi:hypothetical protein
LDKDSSEKEALSRLLVDGTSYMTKLATIAKGIIGVDKSSGKTVYLADTSKLTDEHKVFLVLLGRYFSNKLGKLKSDSCTPAEITDESGLDSRTMGKRLSDLEKARYAESIERGKHRIVPANAERMLQEIREKLGA